VSLSTHEIGFEGLDELTGVDSLCLFVPEDERPLQGAAGFADWRLCGALSRVLMAGFFTGAPEDCLLLPSGGRLVTPRVFVVGVGPRQRLTADALGRALTFAARMLTRAKVEGVALELPGAGVLEDSVRAWALVNQFVPEFKGQQVAVLGDKGFARHLPTAARAER
jgi:hypothetical protein